MSPALVRTGVASVIVGAWAIALPGAVFALASVDAVVRALLICLPAMAAVGGAVGGLAGLAGVRNRATVAWLAPASYVCGLLAAIRAVGPALTTSPDWYQVSLAQVLSALFGVVAGSVLVAAAAAFGKLIALAERRS